MMRPDGIIGDNRDEMDTTVGKDCCSQTSIEGRAAKHHDHRKGKTTAEMEGHGKILGRMRDGERGCR